MNLHALQSIDKLAFTSEEISRKLGISKKSAQVTASRYLSKKILIRLKRDLYTFPYRINNSTEEQLFEIANILQTPSYISLNSALSFYNISTQQTRGFIESISIKRTEERNACNLVFTFTKVREQLYYGFGREDNFFIATPEKSFVDGLYLTSIGRYNLDFFAIDFAKLDFKKIEAFLDNTNTAARNLWLNIIQNL